jgi:hypothetical protein
MDNIKIVNLLASLAKYIPQNKTEALALLGRIWDPLLKFNGWLLNTIGINFQGIINNTTLVFTKYSTIIYSFIAEFIKRLIGRA